MKIIKAKSGSRLNSNFFKGVESEEQKQGGLDQILLDLAASGDSGRPCGWWAAGGARELDIPGYLFARCREQGDM